MNFGDALMPDDTIYTYVLQKGDLAVTGLLGIL